MLNTEERWQQGKRDGFSNAQGWSSGCSSYLVPLSLSVSVLASQRHFSQVFSLPARLCLSLPCPRSDISLPHHSPTTHPPPSTRSPISGFLATGEYWYLIFPSQFHVPSPCIHIHSSYPFMRLHKFVCTVPISVGSRAGCRSPLTTVLQHEHERRGTAQCHLDAIPSGLGHREGPASHPIGLSFFVAPLELPYCA